METKFTKGEWSQYEYDIRDIKNEEGKTIATAWTCKNKEEAEANAKLISAAPELLEALIDMVDYLEEVMEEYGSESFERTIAMDKAKQLIKKATE